MRVHSVAVSLYMGQTPGQSSMWRRVGQFSAGAGSHMIGTVSIRGDFQNSAAQGPEHPDLYLKLPIL